MRNMIVGAVAAAGCWLTLAGAAWAGPQSSPIALSSNGTRLVNVNPEVNTVSVFDATVNPPNRLAEIVVGIEPTSVAIHPNGSRAFVANAGSNTVSVIDLATNTVTRSVTVGAEPLGLALSPNGTRLYVANSSSNTLSIVNTTAPERVIATVQLGSFGSSPRALTVSNDGDADDTDETVFVALFFGQLRAGKTAVDEGQDDQREGRVVSISAATNTALGVTILAPLGDTGFNANGRLAPATGQTPSIASTNPVPQPPATPTGAYPNQLADIALHPTAARAYVVSTAASPNGPLVFNHMAQGLVSVFNTATRT
jgi:YVTN family beta-propeller protein